MNLELLETKFMQGMVIYLAQKNIEHILTLKVGIPLLLKMLP